MSASSWGKRYRKLVMDMNAVRPMDEEEARKDKRYALLLVTFFVVIPLLAGIPFAITGSLLAGAVPTLVSMGIGLFIGLNTRKRILNDFLRVDDAVAYFEIGDLTDRLLLERLCVKRAIAFACDFDTTSLAFIYNWLVARQVLREQEVVQAYRLRGTALKEMYDGDAVPNRDFLVIPYSAWQMPSQQEWRFASELPLVGGVWLGSLVESQKKMKWADALSSSEPIAVRTAKSNRSDERLSNKGQSLD